jgi:hypothetical protein
MRPPRIERFVYWAVIGFAGWIIFGGLVAALLTVLGFPW